MRSASESVHGADGHDHELLEVDVVVGVRAAVEDVHHRHGQGDGVDAAEVAVERQAERRVRPRRATASDTPRMALAPSFDLLDVPSSSIIAAVDGDLVGGVHAEHLGGDLVVDVLDGLAARPCRGSAALSPSRSSTASCSPVEAPEGTARGRVMHLRQLQGQQAEAEMAAYSLAVANQKLRDHVHRLEHDDVYLEKLARERLGWIKPGEIVYRTDVRE
jgi:hypothetical protein